MVRCVGLNISELCVNFITENCYVLTEQFTVNNRLKITSFILTNPSLVCPVISLASLDSKGIDFQSLLLIVLSGLMKLEFGRIVR